MYELKKLEKCLRVNLLGPGPRLMKKNLPGCGLTKVEKHCSSTSDRHVQEEPLEYDEAVPSAFHFNDTTSSELP